MGTTRPSRIISLWQPAPMVVPVLPANRVAFIRCGPPSGASLSGSARKTQHPRRVPDPPLINRQATRPRSAPVRSQHSSAFFDAYFDSSTRPFVASLVGKVVAERKVLRKPARKPAAMHAVAQAPGQVDRWATELLPLQPGSIAASLQQAPPASSLLSLPESDPFVWFEGPYVPLHFRGHVMSRPPPSWPVQQTIGQTPYPLHDKCGTYRAPSWRPTPTMPS